MRKAIFRKVTDGFITLRINGVPTKIGNGERFVADYEIVNGLPGVVFETFGETLTPNNGILQNGNVFTITDAPAMESFVPRDTEEPPDNPHADKDCRKCHGRGKYSFGGSYGGPVHWSSCECVMFKQPPPPKPTITIGFEAELLKSLKAKTPREWMLIKKHELKKIMDDAGIDYSQVSDDRMELYKFLFSILKDLN